MLFVFSSFRVCVCMCVCVRVCVCFNVSHSWVGQRRNRQWVEDIHKPRGMLHRLITLYLFFFCVCGIVVMLMPLCGGTVMDELCSCLILCSRCDGDDRVNKTIGTSSSRVVVERMHIAFELNFCRSAIRLETCSSMRAVGFELKYSFSE